MPDIIANKKVHVIFYGGLYPSEELYPSVEIFPTNISHYPGTVVASGSCNLNQLLCGDKFAIGQACAAKFECQIYNLPDVANKLMEVYKMIDGDESSKEMLFHGFVDSCTQDDFGYYRDVVAYDALQYNRSLNISEWWNDWKTANPNPTLQQVFEALLAQVGLTYYVRDGVISDLVNYDLECYTGFTLEAKRWGDMLQDCLRLLCVSAHIDGSGELELIRFNPNVLTAKDISTMYERGATKFEGYDTAKITGVQLMDSLGTLKYIGDLTYNPLVINSMFLSGKTDTELESICNTIFNELKDVTFRPATIKMIYADTGVQLGDYVQTDKGYTYVLSNELSNVMLIQQDISASAEEYSNQVTEDMSNTEFNTSSLSTPQYYLSTSEEEVVGGEWFDECPRFLNNHYYWVRYKTTAPNGVILYSDPILANGLTEANQLSVQNSSDIIQQADLIAAKVERIGGTSQTFGWNLTADGWELQSNGETVFSVTEEDGLTMIGNATITGGSINIETTSDTTSAIVLNKRMSPSINYRSEYSPRGANVSVSTSGGTFSTNYGINTRWTNVNGNSIQVTSNAVHSATSDNHALFSLFNSADAGALALYSTSSGSSTVSLLGSAGTGKFSSSVTASSFINSSRIDLKENLKKVESVLDKIKNADILSFNFIDDTKKHIGLAIGGEYNVPTEVVAQDENGEEQGVDLYSMVSMAWKAIQEQQEIIESLEARIEALEKKLNPFGKITDIIKGEE